MLPVQNDHIRKNSQSNACNLPHPQKLPTVIACSFWVTFRSWSYVWCLIKLYIVFNEGMLAMPFLKALIEDIFMTCGDSGLHLVRLIHLGGALRKHYPMCLEFCCVCATSWRQGGCFCWGEAGKAVTVSCEWQNIPGIADLSVVQQLS